MEAQGGSEAREIASVDAEGFPTYSPPAGLLPFAVHGAPQGTFYIPNFVDAGTEDLLLQV
jgi:hypothetical protein